MDATDLIPQHPTYKIHDPSKITEFMDCPRKYFFRYVLGWATERDSHHLSFGTAWHDAMEVLLIKGYETEIIKEAYDLFLSKWREKVPEHMDNTFGAKSPSAVLHALPAYVEHYKDIDKDKKTLHTEIAGSVSIGEKNNKDRRIHFRMDSILSEFDMITSMDHKTGSRLSRQWTDQWALSMQMSSYEHVLYCNFPSDVVDGMVVNGVIFTKTRGVDFERVTVKKSIAQMAAWLYDVNHWMDMIEWNFNALFNDCKDTDQVMSAYPRNTNACTKYSGCPYHDMCQLWPNPLSRIHNGPPPGFEKRWWNPADNETPAKHIIHSPTIDKEAPYNES